MIPIGGPHRSLDYLTMLGGQVFYIHYTRRLPAYLVSHRLKSQNKFKHVVGGCFCSAESALEELMGAGVASSKINTF